MGEKARELYRKRKSYRDYRTISLRWGLEEERFNFALGDEAKEKQGIKEEKYNITLTQFEW